MGTSPWLTVLDDTIAACINHHRTDLSDRLERRRATLLDSKWRVPVIGELNQGKSQLVNALVNAPVCAVGDDITTVSPTVIEHAEVPRAALAPGATADVPATGRRAIAAANAEPERVDVPVAELNGRTPVSQREDMHLEVGIPREVLSGGLVLIDTPGLGGRSPTRTATTFATLATADAVLMISDATCELAASEIDLLKQVTTLCPMVTVVLTKIDIVPRWRRVAERNRARLAAAGVRAKVIPVSASVRLTAARSGDQRLNQESGFVELVGCLRNDVLGQVELLSRYAVAAATGTATEQLLTPLHAELTEARKGEQGPAHARWRSAQQRLEEIRKRSARWQTVLNDEVTDLLSDVEFDLRERTRKIVRIADEYFDASDPAKTWDEFAEWLYDRLTETAEINFGWLLDRFEWVARKVTRQVTADLSVYQSVPDEVAPAEDTVDHVGDLEPPRIERFTIGQQLFVGVRGSYGGLLMFGLVTTIAGMSLINPISIGAGVAFGAKSVIDERGSRLKRRQSLAKSTAQRQVDDFFLSYNKESRDTARVIQRRLRDHFSAVVEQVQSGMADSVAKAKQAAEIDIAERRRRDREIAAEVERLAGLHQRIRALAGGCQVTGQVTGRGQPKGLTA